MDLINIMETVDMCGPNGLIPVFTFIGNIVTFIKIAVPIILILMGSIDLTKAVMASKDDEIKKAQTTLMKRAIVGVVIFFIPTIVTLLIGMVTNTEPGQKCLTCVTDPNASHCKIK